MAPYIGTATSRVDGIAKVTGAAKYAADYNVPGLAHGSVVCSTIAKGRITRIDTGAAMSVQGRADRADAREPSADGGQRRRPTRTMWRPTARRSGRCTTTGSCSTASRSRWSSPKRRRSRASRRRWSGWSTSSAAARHRHPCASAIRPFRRRPRPTRSRPCSCRPSRAARPTRRWPAPPCATRPNIHVPIEHHNPMELYASTVIVESGRQAHGLRQDPGRAERAASISAACSA